MTIRDLVRRRHDNPVLLERARPFWAMEHEMNRLFDELFEDFGLRPYWTETDTRLAMFTPSIDISETDKEIRVTAELPGLELKDIDVTLVDNMLTIKGEKKEETEHREDARNYHRVERSYGMFERVIPLPTEVDEEHVTADFHNGILTVTVPRSPEVQKAKRKIEVTEPHPEPEPKEEEKK